MVMFLATISSYLLSFCFFAPCAMTFVGDLVVDMVSPHQPTVSTPLFTRSTFIGKCEVSLLDFCISFSNSEKMMADTNRFQALSHINIFSSVQFADKLLILQATLVTGLNS